MRRFLITLLVLLTVFRGVVGDATAVEMGLGLATNNATEIVAAHAGNTPVNDALSPTNAAKAPCHEGMPMPQAEDAGLAQCFSCQVCHLSAFAPMNAQLSAFQFAQEPPRQATAIWHSAELIASFKPPVF